MSIDIENAVRQNRVYALRLGWGQHSERIYYALVSIFRRITGGLWGTLPHPSPPAAGYEHAPTPEALAEIVAFFQSESENLTEDGIIGPQTWRAIRDTYEYRNPEGGPASVQSWSNTELHLEGTLLTNFDFNSSELKSDHELWLHQFARLKLPSLSGHVWLVGITDRSGTDAYNLDLSRRRALSAYYFLIRQILASLLVEIHVVPMGERLARGRAEFAGSDRGVVVASVANPPPPSLILGPVITSIFFVRALSMASVTPFDLPFSTGLMNLQISDGTFSQTYATVVGTAGGSRTFAEFTGVGPWHIMRLRSEKTVDDFFGVGTYHQRRLHLSSMGITVSPFYLGEGLYDRESQNPSGLILQRSEGRPFRRGVPYRVMRWLLEGNAPGDATTVDDI